MTLLDRIIARGVLMPGDAIMAARIERHVHRIQPDPLFRRRLRTVVLNRYVAVREGLGAPSVARHAARQKMGALGRGVLYASMLTALSVAAVGAASQQTLPGDALFGVKLQLEQLRIHVAPPGLRDDLAAMALNERLDEVEEVASLGRWDLLDAAAANVEAAETQLNALAGPASSSAVLQQHADRLQQLMATAPASALPGLQRALQASTGSDGIPAQPHDAGDQGSVLPNGQAPAPQAPVPGPRDPQSHSAPQGPSSPEPTAQPSPRLSPSPTLSPSAPASGEDPQGGDIDGSSGSVPDASGSTSKQSSTSFERSGSSK